RREALAHRSGRGLGEGTPGSEAPESGGPHPARDTALRRPLPLRQEREAGPLPEGEGGGTNMVDTQRPTITGPVSLNEMVRYTYDRWMESVGIPIHKGYFVEDLRTVPLGRWDERE